MITVSFMLAPVVWVLLGCGFAAAVVATFVSFRRFSMLRRNEECVSAATGKPAASVIALSRDEERLQEFIDAAVSQDYPDYEVIIVQEATKAANSAMSEKYPFTPQTGGDGETTGCRALKFCFFPPGSHALSQRKLALTIGVKAASNPVIVTTDTSCSLPSELWLSSIMRHFDEGVDVVLGYTADDYSVLPAPRRAVRRFCGTMTAGQWIAAALDGKPYRGDGRNMAYKRQLFFDRKGFSESMDLVNGEDDIFVSSIADGGNTAVELSDTSIVVPVSGGRAARSVADSYERYRFTGRYLDRTPYIKAWIASALQWLSVMLMAAAAVLACPNVVAAAAAVVLLAANAVAQTLMYRKGAEALGITGGAWLAAPMLAFRPIFNLWCDMKTSRLSHNFYTYRRG